MAIKYFCDGCGKDVPYDLIKRVSVLIKVTGQMKEAGGEYELCGRCLDRAADGANPLSWARPETAALGQD